jgi:hypothetical protein
MMLIWLVFVGAISCIFCIDQWWLLARASQLTGSVVRLRREPVGRGEELLERCRVACCSGLLGIKLR